MSAGFEDSCGTRATGQKPLPRLPSRPSSVHARSQRFSLVRGPCADQTRTKLASTKDGIAIESPRQDGHEDRELGCATPMGGPERPSRLASDDLDWRQREGSAEDARPLVAQFPLDRYTHLFDDDLESLADSMDARYGAAQTEIWRRGGPLSGHRRGFHNFKPS